MNSRDTCRRFDTPVDALLCRSIQEHAGGRVRDVSVVCGEDRVEVRGKADSYYGWQLALAACQNWLSDRQNLSLDYRFEVVRHVCVSSGGGSEC